MTEKNMTGKEKKCWTAALVLFALFITFTVLLHLVDVQAVGPLGSSVGFGTVNRKFSSAIGINEDFYFVSEIFGYVALLVVAAEAVRGLIQWIKGKSLFMVQTQLFLFGLFLVVLLIFYALFEFIPVNFRPVLEDGELASSYPSSHTMLAVFVYASSIVELSYSLKNRKLKTAVTIIFSILGVLTIVTRILSGYHWISDIVGAVLLSTSLFLLYDASVIHFGAGVGK